jgi:hypothetical protein
MQFLNFAYTLKFEIRNSKSETKNNVQNSNDQNDFGVVVMNLVLNF